MTVVHIGRGAILAESPTRGLREGLRRFVHRKDGGEYEELYTLSKDGETLLTLPGFARRVKGLCASYARILDERMPMPEPLLEAATVGCEVWKDAVCKAVCACGGVVSIPHIFGTAEMTSAILRAFPRDALQDRGTPLSVIAAKDGPSARRLADELARILPEREVGFIASRGYAESEDVIVAPYDALTDVQVQYAGVFVGTDLSGGSFTARARYVTPIRSAARWGILSTAFGGDVEIGMDVEGLFGPLVASISYEDAVRAGIGTPVTVVWIPCPRPNVSLGSAPLDVLSETAMLRNDAFVTLLADLARHVTSDQGFLLCTEQDELARRLAALLPEAVELRKSTPIKEKRAILDDIAGGTVRKAIVSSGCFPSHMSHGVMAVATCGGGEMPGWSFNWRHLKKPGEKAWLVDFRHDWDRHNGRPGRLALNDESRMRRYREMGFAQMTVEGAAQLPF